MSVEITIVCDGCSSIISASSTASAARLEAKRDCGAVVGLPGGKDYCAECVERGLHKKQSSLPS